MTDQSNELLTAVADYVLPAPQRATGEVVVVAPRSDGGAALRRGGDVARAIGQRMQAFGESQQMITAELRERLLALDVAIADASRAQLKGAVHDALAVLDWCDAAQAEQLREGGLAARGNEPLDLAELCETLAADHRSLGQQVAVTGRSSRVFWGDASVLAELVRRAIGIVAERVGGAAVALTVVDGAAGVELLVDSRGEPGDGVEPATVSRFRAAVEQAGASVRPGPLGTGGAGLCLQLPTP